VRLVSPATWKRAAGLVSESRDESDSARKRRSLDRARLLFPNLRLDRVKDHGRAEALLIADYGRLQLAKAAA